MRWASTRASRHLQLRRFSSSCLSSPRSKHSGPATSRKRKAPRRSICRLLQAGKTGMTTRQMPAKADEQHGIRPKGHRLPESTHLGRVRLQVADLERSVAFYEKVLGMRVIRRGTDSVSLGPHGEEHAQNRQIVQLHHLRSARPVPKRGLLGLYHFAILLPDRASLGTFVVHLTELEVHAGMSDHFVSEA